MNYLGLSHNLICGCSQEPRDCVCMWVCVHVCECAPGIVKAGEGEEKGVTSQKNTKPFPGMI